MNYIQKTPFMELYEELSTLNEADVALLEPTNDLISFEESTAMDITDILSEQFTQLSKACRTINEVTGITNGITPAGVFLGLPQQILQGFDYNPANIACHYSSKVTWHFLNEDGVAVYISSSKKAKLIANNFFDLSKSWLFFCVRGTNSAALLDSMASELALDSSKVKLVKVCDGLKNATKDMRIIGLPYGTDANNFILQPFCSWVDSLMIKKEPAAAIQDNAVDFAARRSELERANEFVEYFTQKAKFSSVIKSDIKECGFNVKDLVALYCTGSEQVRQGMIDLLMILGSKIGRKNPVWSAIPDWKSVQYLHNACQQETTLLDIAKEYALEDPNFLLKRNDEATGLDGNNWLLFAQGNENVRGTADFDFIYAKGRVVKVDAKIYYNIASEAKNADKPTAHDAVLLIEYIIANGAGQRWKLRPVHGFDLTNFSHRLAERALRRFVTYLNDNRIEFPRIDRDLKSYT